MTISIKSTNYQPAFGSGNFIEKASKIVDKQGKHLFTQGIAWAVLETAQPSMDWSTALARKLCIDFGEVVVQNLKTDGDIKIENQGTNILAYLTDGARLLKKVANKIISK